MHPHDATTNRETDVASVLAAHFRILGRYNRLANERLYSACAELDDAHW